jgi:hypothetical protein
LNQRRSAGQIFGVIHQNMCGFKPMSQTVCILQEAATREKVAFASTVAHLLARIWCMGARRLLSLLIALLLLWTASAVFACTPSCAPRQYCPCCQPTKHSQPSARTALSLAKFLPSSVDDQVKRNSQEADGEVRFPQTQIASESDICCLDRDVIPVLRSADQSRPQGARLALVTSVVLIHRSSEPNFDLTAETSVRVGAPPSISLRI